MILTTSRPSLERQCKTIFIVRKQENEVKNRIVGDRWEELTLILTKTYYLFIYLKTLPFTNFTFVQNGTETPTQRKPLTLTTWFNKYNTHNAQLNTQHRNICAM